MSRARQLGRLREAWGQRPTRRRNFSAIAASCSSRLRVSAEAPAVDARTWADLDLDEVFAAIDRTESTLGQHALFYRLHTQPRTEDVTAFEGLVDRMATDVDARERAQLALSHLQDLHGYDVWWLTEPGAIERRRWHVIFPFLTVATVMMAALTFQVHTLLPWLIALIVLDVALRYIASAQMSAMAGALRQIAPIVHAGQRLSFLKGTEFERLTAPLREDASRLRRLKTIARWLSGEPFLVPPSTTGVLTALANAIYEYLNIVLLLDANGVYFGSAAVVRHATSIVRLVTAIGDVDTAISVASWREECVGRWTRPAFLDHGSAATLLDAAHPLVEDAVANSIVLQPGRGILVTGSNMSGKTTFIKTLGVNVVLAQTINTCLARSYQAPHLVVQSCIGRSDDLLAGKSYYMVEVEHVLARVRASAESAQHLFLFDELFRGTNAIERIAAGEAVLYELVDGTSHLVIAATHDAELVDLLGHLYAPYHFTDTIGPNGLIFDYKLESGPATTRNAITLLELSGAPPSLVSRALSRAADLDRKRQSR